MWPIGSSRVWGGRKRDPWVGSTALPCRALVDALALLLFVTACCIAECGCLLCGMIVGRVMAGWMGGFMGRRSGIVPAWHDAAGGEASLPAPYPRV